MVPIGPMLLLVLIGSSLVLVHVFYGSYRFLLVLVRYLMYFVILICTCQCLLHFHRLSGGVSLGKAS